MENNIALVVQENKFLLDHLFCRLKIIGEGTYGIVYEAVRLLDGVKVALKKIRLENHDDFDIPSAALREVIILRELKHPSIVNLLSVTNIGNQLWLSFELCNFNLKQYMREFGNNNKNPSNHFLPIDTCKTLSKQLLEGIAYCHSRRIVHRDLKPQNILIDKKAAGLQLKIADFGLSRIFADPEQRITHEVVTLWYRAPELLLGDEHYTAALDVWSAGCIIAEMATGTPLFHGDCEVDTLFRIFQLLGTPKDSPKSWKNVSKLRFYQKTFPQWKTQDEVFKKAIPVKDIFLIDLLSKLLQYPAEKRITASEALNHPWFS